MYLKTSLVIIVILFIPFSGFAQDPTRFQGEVDHLKTKEFVIDDNKEIVVFTGSSSIRMWSNVDDLFSEVNAINTGFGGSHFSDLIHYRDELIFKHNPDKIFIYEGDNDIADGKSPSEIIAGAAFLFAQIKTKLPEAKVYFIAPKPSISRWHLHKEYEETIAMLKQFSSFDESVTFVNVWTPMLNENGEPKADIFIEDDLHMNSKGYEIWAKVIAPYVVAE